MRQLIAVPMLAMVAFHGSLATRQNILNNGGFENGLMCYSEWMWSNTGVNFAGDYQFLLSTDAHSGKYSIEINWAGTDCPKAAIISDMLAAPSQSKL